MRLKPIVYLFIPVLYRLCILYLFDRLHIKVSHNVSFVFGERLIAIFLIALFIKVKYRYVDIFNTLYSAT